MGQGKPCHSRRVGRRGDDPVGNIRPLNRLPLLDFPARTPHPKTIATENPSKLDQVLMRRWRPKLARESAFPSSSERLAFNVQAPYFEISGETNVDEFLYSPSWARHPRIRVGGGATGRRIRVVPEFPLISLPHNLRFQGGCGTRQTGADDIETTDICGNPAQGCTESSAPLSVNLTTDHRERWPATGRCTVGERRGDLSPPRVLINVPEVEHWPLALRLIIPEDAQPRSPIGVCYGRSSADFGILAYK